MRMYTCPANPRGNFYSLTTLLFEICFIDYALLKIMLKDLAVPEKAARQPFSETRPFQQTEQLLSN